MSTLHPDFNDSLLRRDPWLFFDVPASDPVALKRAYTRLLRRWNPERFPAEFMALRAAYDALRSHAATPEVVTATPPVDAPAEPAPPRPPVSARLRESTPVQLRVELEAQPTHTVTESIALAHLRADDEPPGLCVKTLAQTWEKAGPDDDLSGIVTLIEMILAEAPAEEPWRTLDWLAPFSQLAVGFNITAELWIRFARLNPELCLLRLDRLIHFSDAGRHEQHAYFLLRFCHTGAMHLPLYWLNSQCEHLARMPALERLVTPGAGRLAMPSLLSPGARAGTDELALLRAILKFRADLESPALAGHPTAAAYRRLLEARCDNNIEAAAAAWRELAFAPHDDFKPWRANAEAALNVLLRIRGELDAELAPAPHPHPRRTRWMTLLLLHAGMACHGGAAIAAQIGGVLLILSAAILIIMLVLFNGESLPDGWGALLNVVILLGVIAGLVKAHRSENTWWPEIPLRISRRLLFVFRPVERALLAGHLEYRELLIHANRSPFSGACESWLNDAARHFRARVFQFTSRR